MGPERNNFLRRNRIIAGLSDATLVVESALKGGALVTADIAFSYDRQVMVFPGRAGDPMSRGCNALVKNQTASLIENAEDLARLLDWIPDPGEDSQEGAFRQGNLFRPGLSEKEQFLLRILMEHPDADPSVLSRHGKLPVQEVLSLLLTLELKEYVRCAPGRKYLLLD
jgi:DNA processing protein